MAWMKLRKLCVSSLKKALVWLDHCEPLDARQIRRCTKTQFMKTHRAKSQETRSPDTRTHIETLTAIRKPFVQNEFTKCHKLLWVDQLAEPHVATPAQLIWPEELGTRGHVHAVSATTGNMAHKITV